MCNFLENLKKSMCRTRDAPDFGRGGSERTKESEGSVSSELHQSMFRHASRSVAMHLGDALCVGEKGGLP